MYRAACCLCVFTAALTCGHVAAAQEVVHALSGTVEQINPQARTIQLKTNDGSEGVFSYLSQKSTTEMNFDRDVKDRTVPVASFNKLNEQVVVYFYGDGDQRTAVAVQDLGPGPFDIVEGTVTRFNKHQHQVTVKNAAGTEQTFTLDPKAMADSMTGAVPGDRLSPSKGDNVRVIATNTSGNGTALFIRD